MPMIPPKSTSRDTRPRPHYLSGRTTRALGSRIDDWAQRNGYSRSAALEELVRFALERCNPDDALAGIDTLRSEHADQRETLQAIQDHLRGLETRLDALGALTAMGPLILAHWFSQEPAAREPGESPEQAEERTWPIWSEAGEIEWDVRRRRVAPTADEVALEQGEDGPADHGEQAEEPAASPRESQVVADNTAAAPPPRSADDDDTYLV